MTGHIEAIRAALTAGGLTNYYVDVPTDATYPYVLLWSSLGLPPVEESVAPLGDITDTIGFTSVAGTADGALIVRGRVKTLMDGSHPTVTGRLTWLNLYDSLPTAVDRDVTLPSGAHPGYGVDLYRLISTPA